MTITVPPYVLMFMSALVSGLSVLPLFVPQLSFKRWFQSVYLLSWPLLAGTLILTIAISSPWLVLGIVLAALVMAALGGLRARLEHKVGEESLRYLQGLVAIMSADVTLLQALQEIAQRNDFLRAYPRMTSVTQEVVAQVAAGETLANATHAVAQTLPAKARTMWEQIEVTARMMERGSGIGQEAQRDTLNTLWGVLFDVHNINAQTRREMAQMEAAKWLFLGIIPGINAYMWWRLPSYKVFLQSEFVFIIFGIEVLALIMIFIILSTLQRFPEVRV